MKYVIYEMITPEHLQKTVYENYGYRRTVYRNVLEELEVHGVQNTHESLELAIAEITANKNKLKNLQLTILPLFNIDSDGKIR